MTPKTSRIETSDQSPAYTPAVKTAQEQRGSRRTDAQMEERVEQRPWQDTVIAELAEFVGRRVWCLP